MTSELTRDQSLAIAACLLIVAVNDDTMRNLTATQRVTAIGGKRKAQQMLMASGVSPAELKDFAYAIMERKLSIRA